MIKAYEQTWKDFFPPFLLHLAVWFPSAGAPRYGTDRLLIGPRALAFWTKWPSKAPDIRTRSVPLLQSSEFFSGPVRLALSLALFYSCTDVDQWSCMLTSAFFFPKIQKMSKDLINHACLDRWFHNRVLTHFMPFFLFFFFIHGVLLLPAVFLSFWACYGFK